MEVYTQAIIAVVVVLIFMLLIWIFCLRRSGVQDRKYLKLRESEEYEATYNLQNLSLPRLYGWRLKLFSKIGSSIFGKAFIVPVSMKQSNMDVLRTLLFPEKPVLYPLQPAKTKAVDVNDGKMDIDLSSFAQEKAKAVDGFRFNTISDYINAYRSGKTTPTDVAKHVISTLEALDKTDPPMCVIIQSNKQEILDMAEASTARYKNNAPLSVFDGVPVTAKDELKIAGYRCYNGASFLGETVETEETEAMVMKKLRNGGAVIIGVANMHQLGMGTTGCNGSRLHGTSRNPYNPDHFCGGSSSGSGAAVACGLVPMAIGVDGGGSVRIPASVCGAVGVKATFGRISSSGVFQFSDTVGYVGPMCTTVRDAALSYAFMAGPDPRFPPSLEQPPISLDGFDNTDLTGVRIGIDWTYFKHGDPFVVQLCSEAVRYLEEECKAEVVSINIPELEETRIAHFITITSEMATYGVKMRAEHIDELMHDCQAVFNVADCFTARDYIVAQKQRNRAMMIFENLFTRVDVILTPTLPMVMPKIEPGALKTGLLDAGLTGKTMRYMFHGNLIGVPCLTLPVGYDDNNMPVGLQIMANWWDEAMMFRIGHAAEGYLKVKNRPQVFYELL
ncbi:uncharacterized protein LOC135685446 isoform X2 [Rhopilema esculentum]|uniref:uncharacterized protein LOC135685446 isoform X2 n=1 Tax=Rhopilema esculentum TaxID=499914 RepID=UPI0031CF8818